MFQLLLFCAQHAWEKQHHSSWDETAILDQTRNTPTLLIKEAFISFTKQQKLMNKDWGIIISKCWRPLLGHVLCTHPSRLWPHPQNLGVTHISLVYFFTSLFSYSCIWIVWDSPSLSQIICITLITKLTDQAGTVLLLCTMPSITITTWCSTWPPLMSSVGCVSKLLLLADYVWKVVSVLNWGAI